MGEISCLYALLVSFLRAAQFGSCGSGAYSPQDVSSPMATCHFLGPITVYDPTELVTGGNPQKQFSKPL